MLPRGRRPLSGHLASAAHAKEACRAAFSLHSTLQHTLIVTKSSYSTPSFHSPLCEPLRELATLRQTKWAFSRCVAAGLRRPRTTSRPRCGRPCPASGGRAAAERRRRAWRSAKGRCAMTPLHLHTTHTGRSQVRACGVPGSCCTVAVGGRRCSCRQLLCPYRRISCTRVLHVFTHSSCPASRHSLVVTASSHCRRRSFLCRPPRAQPVCSGCAAGCALRRPICPQPASSGRLGSRARLPKGAGAACSAAGSGCALAAL